MFAQLIKDVPVRSFPKDFWKNFEVSLAYIRQRRNQYFEGQLDCTYKVLHQVRFWFVMWDIKHGPIEEWAA